MILLVNGEPLGVNGLTPVFTSIPSKFQNNGICQDEFHVKPNFLIFMGNRRIQKHSEKVCTKSLNNKWLPWLRDSWPLRLTSSLKRPTGWLSWLSIGLVCVGGREFNSCWTNTWVLKITGKKVKCSRLVITSVNGQTFKSSWRRTIVINLSPHLTTKLPDKFVRQGVNKEFQWVKFLQISPNYYKSSINLSDHEADLVGFLTREPPLFWDTAQPLFIISLVH